MISFVNTQTKTVGIPEGADIWHRNKVHKLMGLRFGVYDVIRLNPGKTSDYDIALLEFDPGGKQIAVYEISAKPDGWTWDKLAETMNLTKMLLSKDVSKVKIVNVE